MTFASIDGYRDSLMRIRFAGPADTERAARKKASAELEGFHAALARTDVVDVASFERALVAALARVSPDLRVEVDAVGARERRVVVAPEEDGLEPLALQVIASAPRREGVTLVRHRPPLDIAAAVEDVRARTGKDLANARVRLGFSRGHLLELVVHSPSFGSASDEEGLVAANLISARLLGDELFDDWVGAVDVAPLPRGGSLRVLADGARPDDATLVLSEVFPAVEAAVRGVDASLPEAPYHAFCERAGWTMLELDPNVASDYPTQEDIALLSTMLPEALKSFLQGARFSSRRFSRHGERFAYAKIDAQHGTVEERHALGLKLEDALNRALVPGRFGCVVGAGLGARYLYLFLAFESFDAGIDVARRRLRKMGVDRRSWLLFCDTGWHREWLGVWDETGPPP